MLAPYNKASKNVPREHINTSGFQVYSIIGIIKCVIVSACLRVS